MGARVCTLRCACAGLLRLRAWVFWGEHHQSLSLLSLFSKKMLRILKLFMWVLIDCVSHEIVIIFY